MSSASPPPPWAKVCYLIIMGQELVLNNLVPDTDPEDKTKDSVHDGLFKVTDDEHQVEGLNSDHKALKPEVNNVKKVTK